METVNATIQRGSNIILSSAQTAEVPNEPVRGTYVESLMLGVLYDKAPGMSAIYAEALASRLQCGKSNARRLVCGKMTWTQP